MQADPQAWAFGARMPPELATVADADADAADADGPCANTGEAKALLLGQWASRYVWPLRSSAHAAAAPTALAGPSGREAAELALQLLGILCDNGLLIPKKQNVVSMLATLVAISSPGQLQTAVLAAIRALASGTTIPGQKLLVESTTGTIDRVSRPGTARHAASSSWCGCFGCGSRDALPPAHRVNRLSTSMAGARSDRRSKWAPILRQGLAAERQLLATVHGAAQAIDWLATHALQGARKQLADGAAKTRTRWSRVSSWERVRAAAVESVTLGVVASTGFGRHGHSIAGRESVAASSGSARAGSPSVALFAALAARLGRLGVSLPLMEGEAAPDAVMVEAVLRGASLLCETSYTATVVGSEGRAGAAVATPEAVRAASVSPSFTSLVRVLCEASWASSDPTDCKPGRGGLPAEVVGRWRPLMPASASSGPERVIGPAAVLATCGWGATAAEAIVAAAESRGAGGVEASPASSHVGGGGDLGGVPRLETSRIGASRASGDARLSEHSAMHVGEGLRTATVHLAVRGDGGGCAGQPAAWTQGALMLVGGSSRILLAAHSLYRATGDRPTLKFVSASGYGGALASLMGAAQRLADARSSGRESVPLFTAQGTPGALACAPIMRPWLSGPAGLLSPDAGEGHGPRKEAAVAALATGWAAACWARPDDAGGTAGGGGLGGVLQPAADRWAAQPAASGAESALEEPFAGLATEQGAGGSGAARTVWLRVPAADGAAWTASCVRLPALPVVAMEAEAMTLTAAAAAPAVQTGPAASDEAVTARGAAAAAASASSTPSPWSDKASLVSVGSPGREADPVRLSGASIAPRCLLLQGSAGRTTAELIGPGAAAAAAACARGAGGTGCGELLVTPLLLEHDTGGTRRSGNASVVNVRFRQSTASGDHVRLVLSGPLPDAAVAPSPAMGPGAGVGVVLGLRCQRAPLLVTPASGTGLRPSERRSSAAAAPEAGGDAVASNTASALAAIGWAAGATLIARVPPRMLLDCRCLAIHSARVEGGERKAAKVPHPFEQCVAGGWGSGLLLCGAEALLSAMSAQEVMEAAMASGVEWPPASMSLLEQVPLPPQMQRWIDAGPELLATVAEAEGDTATAEALRGAETPALAAVEAAAAMLCREAWTATRGIGGTGHIPAMLATTPAAAASGRQDLLVCAMESAGMGWRDCVTAMGLRGALGGDAGAQALWGWGIGGVELADALADGAGAGAGAEAKPLVLDDVFRVHWSKEFAAEHHPVRLALNRFLAGLSPAHSAAFLHFVTGSRLRPPPGAEALRVESAGSMAVTEQHWMALLQTLPQAHTCTNTLELPDYLSAVTALADKLGIDNGDAGALGREAERVTLQRLETALSMGGGSTYGLDDDGEVAASRLDGSSRLWGQGPHSHSTSATSDAGGPSGIHSLLARRGGGVGGLQVVGTSATSSRSPHPIGGRVVVSARHSNPDTIEGLLAAARPAAVSGGGVRSSIGSATTAAAAVSSGADWRANSSVAHGWGSASGPGVLGTAGSSQAGGIGLGIREDMVAAPWERQKLPQTIANLAQGSSNGTHDTAGRDSRMGSVFGNTASTGGVLPLAGAVESRESERAGPTGFGSSESSHFSSLGGNGGPRAFGRTSGMASAGRSAMRAGGVSRTAIATGGAPASHSPPWQVRFCADGLQPGGERTMVQDMTTPKATGSLTAFASLQSGAEPWSST